MNAPVNPGESEFAAFAKNTNSPVTPLVFRAPNDGVLAWAAFAALQGEHPFAFLLESADAGENGRYSFMGAAPRRLFVFADGVFSVRDGGGKTLSENTCDDPAEALRAQMDALAAAPLGDGLPPFWGGAVGYMGYDCAHYFENIGAMKPDLLRVPDMVWMQTDLLAVFDHRRHEVYVIKSCYAEDANDGDDWRARYRRGRAQAEALLARISEAKTARLRLPPPRAKPPSLRVESNMTRDEFHRTVTAFKKHIQDGDIFQGVPSQRLSFAPTAPTLDIYRCLRRMNPSPYMFYLKCGDFVAAGASPELMISRRGKRLELRPIAGTRPRGDTPEKDAALEAELLADEKEIAEHLMLVDLARNDAGRVAAAGTVRVPRFCAVERYSHVMHIVSAVEGELRDSCSAFDALRAAFPAGTLSGAPKVRAMQLINRYESCRRNIYGGCAGYAGFDGDMSMCIAIRSFVAKGGRCYVQAGGGVVADSQPEKEYRESMDKAAAVLRAAEAAEEEYGGGV
ncbi:MAG: anthranilate synthase component I [Gammaproteobacteria bacterium]